MKSDSFDYVCGVINGAGSALFRGSQRDSDEITASWITMGLALHTHSKDLQTELGVSTQALAQGLSKLQLRLKTVL